MKFLVTFFLILFASMATAGEFESAETIHLAINNALVKQIKLDNNDKINLGHIDSRLKLQKCAEPLSVFFPANTRNNRMLVGVRCDASPNWKLFVPVQVMHTEEVIVARVNVASNSVLTEDDIELQMRDVASDATAHLTNIDTVLGMQIKRAVRSGTAINKSMLKYPIVVKRGDMVQIIAEKGTLRIQMKGIAQKNGALHDSIPVKNLNSSRVIVAQVTGSGVTKAIL